MTLFYRDMKVSCRADLARHILERTELTDLAGLGIALILIACAKTGDTALESRDILRSLIPQMEGDLFEGWDQLRRTAI